MASDQLRKKWGTVFMGEREATVDQLDAMQEPLRRERAQQQEQEDYFARVRAKAEERAREILGAAYAERQKVLDEARAEAQELKQRLLGETGALKAQAQEEKNQAKAEQDKAQALREQAQSRFDTAHGEGFQSGMDQAGQELKEFRAEMGQALGSVLYALDAQRRSMCDAWREELALLTQEAVTAGTGWVLEEEHKRILQSLVFESLNLLEDRASITVRVHPDDEDTVGDMFMAARERVPELQQWIVNGDASVERGGLVAESVSGSVDCRREHYAELVNGILSYLTLGPDQKEDSDGEAVSQLVRQEAERIAAMAPAPEYAATAAAHADMPPHAGQANVPAEAAYGAPDGAPDGVPGGVPDAAPHEVAHEAPNGASHGAAWPQAGDPLDVGLPQDSLGDFSGGMAGDYADGEPQSLHLADELAPAADELAPAADELAPAADEPAPAAGHEASAPDNRAMTAEGGGAQAGPVASPESAEGLTAQGGAAENAGWPGTEATPPGVAPAAPEQSGLGQAPEQGAHTQAPEQNFSGQSPEQASPALVPPAVSPVALSGTRPADPTLAELEDELFPLEDELGGMSGQPNPAYASGPAGHPGQPGPADHADYSGQPDHPGQPGPADQAGHDVFSQGGFLPGAGKGR